MAATYSVMLLDFPAHPGMPRRKLQSKMVQNSGSLHYGCPDTIFTLLIQYQYVGLEYQLISILVPYQHATQTYFVVWSVKKVALREFSQTENTSRQQ